MATDRHDRSADEIRRDIEDTRADMHETVDALERKLSPGQLVDEVWSRVRTSGGTGGAGAIGDVIRDHPLPLALMGLGVAWLAVEKATESPGERLRSRHGHVGAGTYEPAEGRVGPYRGDAVSQGEETSALDNVKDRASSAMETVKGKASELTDRAKSKAEDAMSGIRGAGSDSPEWSSDGGDEDGDRLQRAKSEARGGARRAQHGFRSALEEQPMALGALAFGLGLASGLAAPTTRKEDELMGRASDAVKREAKETARDAAESAKHVAKESARAAKEEADRQDVVGDLKESGRRIAAEAKETAKERAREEGLDPEGLKERASEGSDRVRDRARE